MSKKEAIKVLKEYLALDKDIDSEYLEAQKVVIKAMEQELKQEPYEKFESTKDHIYKLAGDYKCWDNRLTHDEALELCHILEEQENPNSIRINFVGEEEAEEFKEYLKNQQEPILDKIRKEIKTKYDSLPWRNNDYDDGWVEALEWVLDIIDKTESEE